LSNHLGSPVRPIAISTSQLSISMNLYSSITCNLSRLPYKKLNCVLSRDIFSWRKRLESENNCQDAYSLFEIGTGWFQTLKNFSFLKIHLPHLSYKLRTNTPPWLWTDYFIHCQTFRRYIILYIVHTTNYVHTYFAFIKAECMLKAPFFIH